MILTSERAQVSGGPVLGPSLTAHVVDGVEGVGVVHHPGNVDVAGHAGLDGVLPEAGSGCVTVQEAEAIWRRAGRWIPLDAAISLLLSDAGLVILGGQ